MTDEDFFAIGKYNKFDVNPYKPYNTGQNVHITESTVTGSSFDNKFVHGTEPIGNKIGGSTTGPSGTKLIEQLNAKTSSETKRITTNRIGSEYQPKIDKQKIPYNPLIEIRNPSKRPEQGLKINLSSTSTSSSYSQQPSSDPSYVSTTNVTLPASTPSTKSPHIQTYPSSQSPTYSTPAVYPTRPSNPTYPFGGNGQTDYPIQPGLPPTIYYPGQPIPGSPGTAIGVYPPPSALQPTTSSHNPNLNIAISQWPLFSIANTFGGGVGNFQMPANCPCYLVESQKNKTNAVTKMPPVPPTPAINNLQQLFGSQQQTFAGSQQQLYPPQFSLPYGVIGYIPVILFPYCPGNGTVVQNAIQQTFPAAIPYPYPCSQCNQNTIKTS